MSYPAIKYDPAEFDRLWQSAKPNGTVRLGTLYHHAKQNGWLDPKLDVLSVNSTKGQKDILNGRLFADEYRGCLLFVSETGDLLEFTDAGWVRRRSETGDAAAKRIVDKLSVQALELRSKDPDSPVEQRLRSHIRYSSSRSNLKSMIELAKSELGMSVSLSDMDANPWLLGVKNGILDLKSGNLLQTSPEQLVSKRANVEYDPGADCPIFDRFLVEVKPDPAVRRLLRQLAGVWLCGEPHIQKLIMFYGMGANGKTTFIELMAWLLGEYSCTIQTETLLLQSRSSQNHSTDILQFKGQRLVYCNEIDEGKHLANALVKQLTGGDSLTARPAYGKEYITFRPSHNLVMVGNHMPEVRDTSSGMWRRILLIPFKTEIPRNEQDPYLQKKLKKEGAGILNWALAGLHDYRKNDLVTPASIDSANDVYRSDQDIIGEWIHDCCKTGPTEKTVKEVLYRNYEYWAQNCGYRPVAQGRFTRRLRELGYSLDKGKRKFLGLKLKNNIF